MSIKAKWTGRILSFFDSIYNPEQPGRLWAKCPLLAIACDPEMATVFEDDFLIQASTKASQFGNWVIIEDDGAGGTDAIQARKNGWYKHYCDGDDNDEMYMATKTAQWQLEASKPLWFEAGIEWTNSATTAGAFILGIMEGGGAADTLQDTEAGPLADYDGFCFFKQSGETSISFESSIATDQVTNATFHTYASGTPVVLGAYWDGVSTITPYVNGVAGTPHTIATGGALGKIVHGCKSNGAEEAFEWDFVKVVQIR